MIRIKEIRKAKKITAKQLADFVNVAESTMSLYENGKREPDYETLLKIADFLGVTVDHLLGRTENKLNLQLFAQPEQKENSPAKASEDAIKIALFGGDTEITDEMWNEVMNYAEYLKQKYGKA